MAKLSGDPFLYVILRACSMRSAVVTMIDRDGGMFCFCTLYRDGLGRVGPAESFFATF